MYKKISLIVLGLCVFSNSVYADRITPQLLSRINSVAPDEFISINIIMENQVDLLELEELAKKNAIERRNVVISYLRTFAHEEQANLLKFLSDVNKECKGILDIKSFWIINAINCKTIAELIPEIAAQVGVRSLDWDEKQFLIPPLNPVPVDDLRGIEWNIQKIRAPEVWSQGYRGQGIVVGVLDSGVNYNHNDLKDHMWTAPGYPHHGYDFVNNDNNPMDDFGHGTHCAGIVAGDGTSGNKTGVAPDAKIMALKVLDSQGNGQESDAWAALQFAIENGAHIASLSIGWIHAQNPDRSTWRTTCNSALAAGLVMAVAAGNEGQLQYLYPIPDNVRTPGDVPPPWLHPDQTLTGGRSAVITVGATDSDDNITNFSSRGPVTWENVDPFNDYSYNPGMGLIKPDVSAPGKDINSLRHDNNTGYRELSGTSMAAPHVAGLLALILSRNSNIPLEFMDRIIETSSIDRGPSGKDNEYGAGRVDALESINKTPSTAAKIYAGMGSNLYMLHAIFTFFLYQVLCRM